MDMVIDDALIMSYFSVSSENFWLFLFGFSSASDFNWVTATWNNILPAGPSVKEIWIIGGKYTAQNEKF